MKFGVNRQVCCRQRGIVEMRHRHRRTQRHRARRHQVNRSPQPHVLIRRTWIPVNPVDAKVFFRWSKRFHCEHIFFPGLEQIGHIEVIGAIRAGNRLRSAILWPFTQISAR